VTRTAKHNDHPLEAVLALLAVGLVAGFLLASVAGSDAPWLGALALLAAGSLLVLVPVPWGGDVPLGYALVGALPALLDAPDAALVVGSGVALALAGHATRHSRQCALRTGLRIVPACAAAVAAGAATPDGGGESVLVHAVVAVGALLAVDALLTRRAPASGSTHVNGARLSLVQALPVYLTIACGAALVAVATDRVGVVMATVAVFPLLITRFSFRRYAGAGETLRQTVQALGLVPELAGLAPLGHSERASVYGRALAEELKLGDGATERIVTASRLHHLGAVPFDPSDADAVATASPADIAEQGALILREAGFPGDVADLIEAARAGSLDGPAPSLDAAVVRVASAFDEVVGDDEALADRGLALVSATAIDPHSRRAAAALLELVATRPTLVSDAIAAGARFRDAASGLDLDALVTSGAGGEILPFARRRR
jgi:hypothetical protein